MGLSSSKSKNKPIYKAEIGAASNSLSSAYNDSAPAVTANASAISDLVPSLLDKYKAGDPTINAAQGYAQGILSGQSGYNYTPDSYLTSLRDSSYQSNPYFSSVMNGMDGSNTSLEAMIAQTNNSVANSTNAKLGTRGLTGGTVQSDILSRNLAQNETGLRYTDYTTQQARRDAAAAQEASLAQAYAGRQDNAALTEAQRRDQAMQLAAQEKASAAGMAPGLLAAQNSLLDPALTAANAATVPFTLASNYASGVGGLLGQYQTTKTSSPWGPALISAASNAAGAYFGAKG